MKRLRDQTGKAFLEIIKILPKEEKETDQRFHDSGENTQLIQKRRHLSAKYESICGDEGTTY